MTKIPWKENEKDKDGWKMEGNRTGSVAVQSVATGSEGSCAVLPATGSAGRHML